MPVRAWIEYAEQIGAPKVRNTVSALRALRLCADLNPRPHGRGY